MDIAPDASIDESDADLEIRFLGMFWFIAAFKYSIPRPFCLYNGTMRTRTIILALLSIVLAYGVFHVVTVVSYIRNWERFLTLQQQQLATIKKIENFPPPGITNNEWKNELITLYNVWVNVLYKSESATPLEMTQLQEKLDEIISETTNANSFESVDRTFGLLLDRNQSNDFVIGYRDAFREYHRSYLSEKR